jgi:hypothetical protein
MTSNPNLKIPVPPLTTAAQSKPVSNNTYAPSVPISVYRQLAAELQATRVMLDSLNAQNQHLVQQNQQMRLEINKIAHSVVHLQQLADASVSSSWSDASYKHPEMRNQPGQAFTTANPLFRRPRAASSNPPIPVVDVPNVFKDAEPMGGFLSDQLVREQAQGRYRYRSQIERSAELNGWWYTLGVVLIMIVAFGAGFLIVKPLLSGR